MPTAQRHNNKKNFLAKSNNTAISSRNLRTSTILFDEIKVVVCPAFAESITEGDLRWEKAAGDAVAEDEVKITVLYWSIVEVSPLNYYNYRLIHQTRDKSIHGQKMTKKGCKMANIKFSENSMGLKNICQITILNLDGGISSL